MNLDFNKKVSIIIIWLFHLSGLLGLLYVDKNLFASLTPLNLFISTTLLFVNQTNASRLKFFIIFLIFFVGMIAEILGVQYGLIFGNYEYGNNLGLKILGVPMLSRTVSQCLKVIDKKDLFVLTDNQKIYSFFHPLL